MITNYFVYTESIEFWCTKSKMLSVLWKFLLLFWFILLSLSLSLGNKFICLQFAFAFFYLVFFLLTLGVKMTTATRTTEEGRFFTVPLKIIIIFDFLTTFECNNWKNSYLFYTFNLLFWTQFNSNQIKFTWDLTHKRVNFIQT